MLLPHIAAGYFPALEWIKGPGVEHAPLSIRAAVEVENLRNFLRAIAREAVPLRDLLLFQRGYNSAYTDYASGKWSES